jgi:hypothetical protein
MMRIAADMVIGEYTGSQKRVGAINHKVVQRLMNRLSHLKLRSGLSDTAPGGVSMAARTISFNETSKLTSPMKNGSPMSLNSPSVAESSTFHQSLISSITK